MDVPERALPSLKDIFPGEHSQFRDDRRFDRLSLLDTKDLTEIFCNFFRCDLAHILHKQHPAGHADSRHPPPPLQQGPFNGPPPPPPAIFVEPLGPDSPMAALSHGARTFQYEDGSVRYHPKKMKTTHPNDVDQELDEDDEDDGDEGGGERRRHLCPKCGKRFNRPSSLKIHLNTHTGAKRESCVLLTFASRFCSFVHCGILAGFISSFCISAFVFLAFLGVLCR